jgi:hypothetical protein
VLLVQSESAREFSPCDGAPHHAVFEMCVSDVKLECPQSCLNQLGCAEPRSCTRHGLTVKATAFESIPLHDVVDLNPVPTKVVPPSGGLNTKTGTAPGCAISRTVMVATNSCPLTNVVTTNEPFQLTTESPRKLFPLTVSRNWLPPADALLGKIEVIDGAGGQVPQDTTIATTIASTAKPSNLACLAIGWDLMQPALRNVSCGSGGKLEGIGGNSRTSQLVRQIHGLYTGLV